MAHRKLIVLGSAGSQGTDVVEQAALSDGSPRSTVTAISDGRGHLDLLPGQAAVPVLVGWGHP